MLDDRIIFVNLILCTAIFWSCVCRLKLTSTKVYLRVRNRYVFIGTGALFGGLGNWIFPFNEGALLGLCLFVGSVALGFWLDKKDWDRGVPPSATIPGELHATPKDSQDK